MFDNRVLNAEEYKIAKDSFKLGTVCGLGLASLIYTFAKIYREGRIKETD